MELREVIIQQVKAETKPFKTGTNEKTKKQWSMYSVGVKIKDNWFNCTTFDYNELLEMKKWEAGQAKLLIFYQEEWKDKDGNQKKQWRFRLPKIEEENNHLLKKIWSKLNG